MLASRTKAATFELMNSENPTSLEELLDRLEETAADAERVSIGMIVSGLGQRSFAPIVLVAGLMAFSPISGIPGVPTLVAIMVALTAGQLVMRRESLWLPQWLKRRSVARGHFDKALRFTRRPARWVDRWLRPRWKALTRGAGTYAVALLCLLIAAAMPPLELIPFAATGTGAALTAFSLALIAQDGLLEVIAICLTLVTFGLAIHALTSGLGS